MFQKETKHNSFVFSELSKTDSVLQKYSDSLKMKFHFLPLTKHDTWPLQKWAS
jgi:hypothetical protein